MRALITGASGFVGWHLMRELAGAGWAVVPTSITPLPEQARDRPGAAAAEPFIELDITSGASVRRALDTVSPDTIFHLAGISSVTAAERDPVAAFQTNAVGIVVLLRELIEFRDRSGKNPAVLVVGSAEQYGRHEPGEIPLREGATLRPSTVYAASKCAQEIAALQMFRAQSACVICVRSFNHAGQGQRPEFLVPALIRRALALREEGGSRLPVGNTTPVRDYLHVNDVVRAYRLLVERGTPGEIYNVCSGVGRSVGDIARAVLDRVGVAATLEVREELLRPIDVPILVGSNEQLRRTTGWEPVHRFEDILEDMISAAS